MLGSYEINRLVQQEYRERMRKSEWREVEGITIRMPTLHDRIVQAVRVSLATLASCANRVRRPSTQLTPSGGTAK
jgi:hypothetical protein